MTSERPVGRLTPYELVFGDPRFEEREFPVISDEAEKRGLDASRRDEFALLGQVGLLLDELAPKNAGAPRDHYVDILYHAFHFARQGHRIYAFEEPVLRSLVEGAPDTSVWTAVLPGPAFYLELPRQLFWVAAAEGRSPEPVEGAFVRRDDSAVSTSESVQALLVSGMWPDRPGFTTAALDLELGSLPCPGPDEFRAELPGADLAELYRLRDPVHAAVLFRRMLWYIDRRPAAVRHVSADREATGTDRPRRTALDHWRVAHVEESAG